MACISGHDHTVALLLRHRANKNKLNFMREKAVDCIGKFQSAKRIRSMLADEEPAAEEGKDGHSHDRQEQKQQDRRQQPNNSRVASGRGHDSRDEADERGRGSSRPQGVRRATSSEERYQEDFD